MASSSSHLPTPDLRSRHACLPFALSLRIVCSPAALGFFGWPLDGKVLMEVTVEEKGVNNTLAPYKTCTNDSMKDARALVSPQVGRGISQGRAQAPRRVVEGVELEYEDVYVMQLICAYEVCHPQTPMNYSSIRLLHPWLLLLLRPLHSS